MFYDSCSDYKTRDTNYPPVSYIISDSVSTNNIIGIWISDAYTKIFYANGNYAGYPNNNPIDSLFTDTNKRYLVDKEYIYYIDKTTDQVVSQWNCIYENNYTIVHFEEKNKWESHFGCSAVTDEMKYGLTDRFKKIEE
jgi:hypothetical protein